MARNNTPEPIVLISSQFCVQWHPIGSLKLAIVGVIYAMAIGKCYKWSELLFGFPESQIASILLAMNVDCVLV